MFKFNYELIIRSCSKIILLFLFTAIGVVLTASIPRLMGKFIDSLYGGNFKENGILIFGILFTVLSILLAISNYNENMCRVKLSNILMVQYYHCVIKTIESLPLSFINEREASELNNLISNDCNDIIAFLMNCLTNLMIRIVFLIYLVIYILNISLILGMFVACISIINIIFTKSMGKKVVLENNTYRNAQSKYFGITTERVKNIKFTKINLLSDWYEKKTLKEFENFFVSILNYSKLSYLFSNFSFYINQFATLVLLTFSGFLISRNQMSIGSFIIINSYFLLINSQIAYFVSFTKQMYDFTACSSRIKSFMNQEKDKDGKEILKMVESIKVEEVHLIYGTSDFINFEFVTNNIYCIQGENGKGKSTLIDTLIGLLPVAKGKIQFNNIDMTELNKVHLRSNLVSFMEQPPTILADYYEDNLFERADLQLTETIQSKIDNSKYLTQISNDICSLNCRHFSGGERLKLGIVRSFIKDGNLMIFDEPTANLDDDSVEMFLSELNLIKKNKIIILISHDRRVSKYIDAVLSI